MYKKQLGNTKVSTKTALRAVFYSSRFGFKPFISFPFPIFYFVFCCSAMASAVIKLCKGLDQDFVKKLVQDHCMFLPESNGAYRVKPNKVFVSFLDQQDPDILPQLWAVTAFVKSVDLYHLKRISGPLIKSKAQYGEWAKREAKRGKKLVRLHRRNIGKVKVPAKLKPRAVSSAKIAATLKARKSMRKVRSKQQIL